MSKEYQPIVAQWYRHLDKGQPFQVVAVDDDTATVEIQHFDGDVEELDLDDWRELELEPIEAPEDWTGPVDDIDRDDLGYTETDMTAADWGESLREGAAREQPEVAEPEEGEEEQ